MVRDEERVPEAVLTTLAGSLAELARDTCAQIYADLDSYAGIPSDALTSAVTRNLTTALTALREHAIPDPARLDGAAQTARERFEAGVPVEEIVRGFRISIALIHQRFVDLAVTQRVSATATVEGVRIMWGVADAFTTRIITTYHALEVDTALRDAQRRVHAVRALLAGESGIDEATRAALEPTASYAAVRCEAASEDAAAAARASLERTGSTPTARALVVVDGVSCLGVVATRPGDVAVPVGLGPFVGLADLPRSDRAARQCLRAATRSRRTGVQSVTDLGWRLAATAHPDVSAHYAATFLAPLDAEGAFGREIGEAVLAWLTHGHSIPRAASALTVHPNTVRYRLGRFADLTGCDLDDADDRLGAYWALSVGQPPTGDEL